MSEEKKTHWRLKDKTEYLGAVDLDELGGKIAVTIVKVEWKEVTLKDGKQEKRVATFQEGLKPMIINVTNGKILKKFTGSKYLEKWVNIPVTIYVVNIKAFNEETEALRFEATQPKKEKPELTPDSAKWDEALLAVENGSVTCEQIRSNYDLSEENEKILCGSK